MKSYFRIVFIALFAVLHTGYANYSPWKEVSEATLRENLHRLSPNSLNRKAFWKYSQYGEDGIIHEIFHRLNIDRGFFVEFGAMDGITISNTRFLYEQGWEGVMIEPNTPDYETLCANYPPSSGVIPLNYFVTHKSGDSRGLLFDQIKELHFPDREIDFLSIDVDGADYYIFKSLQCRPKVICIEANFNWHPLMNDEVPESIAIQNQQQPLLLFIEQAKQMGYEPVCLTINLFLVREDLMNHFSDVPKDALTIWTDGWRSYYNKKRELESLNSSYKKYSKERNLFYIDESY